MLRNVSYLTMVVCLGMTNTPLSGQGTPPDTVRGIARLHDRIARRGALVGARIWPGFHPESIPTLYVIPHRAKLLVSWRDTLLHGFARLPGVSGAMWTDTQLVSFPSGRNIAFLSVDSSATVSEVIGLALHEEFHSFEHMVRREGRRFGGGENAMLVADYPVFDIDNEARWAVEGRLLRAAFQARSTSEARALARRFLGAREQRQARLDTALVEFEQMAELNEGLAQYALLRGQIELADGPKAVAVETGLLDSLLALTRRSIRRRFYATGGTMGLLLDRLVGPGWKRALMAGDRTVQQALAVAVDYHGVSGLGTAWADSLQALTRAARPAAERAITALRDQRRSQADSILAQRGLSLSVEASGLPGRHFDYCGFDPQNLLQVGDGRVIHGRFLRLCAGDSVSVTFDQAAVEDRATGAFRTVIADPASLVVKAAGVPFTLPDTGSVVIRALEVDAAGFSLTAAKATITKTPSAIRIAP